MYKAQIPLGSSGLDTFNQRRRAIEARPPRQCGDSG